MSFYIVLKEVEGYELFFCFIDDNLTTQRANLLRKLKNADYNKSAWSVDEKLKVVMCRDGKEEIITIDSLNDVAFLGWSEK